jgi:hypothetical protein
MHTLQIFDRKFQIPGKWNELSKSQLLKIAQLFSKKLTKETFEVLLISYFTGIKPENMKIISSSLSEIAALFNFIHNKITLTKNFLPELTVKKKILYGPEDGLLNLTFEQFIIYSENAYREYSKNQSPEILDYFISTLYTFKQSEFNEKHISAIQKLITKIPSWEKTAIFLFYVGSRNYLVDKYKELFSNTSQTSDKNTDPLAFLKLIDQLNNEDVTKNEMVKTSKIYEVFFRLNEMVKKSDKLRSKLKSNV